MIGQRPWLIVVIALLAGVLTYIFLPTQVQDYVRETQPRRLAALIASLLAGNVAWLVLYYYRPPLPRIALYYFFFAMGIGLAPLGRVTITTLQSARVDAHRRAQVDPGGNSEEMGVSANFETWTNEFTANDVWIFVLGLCFACLGYYLYRDAIREEQRISEKPEEGTAAVSKPQKVKETGGASEQRQAAEKQREIRNKSQGGKRRRS